MSNYTVTVNFANKDSLPSGSSDKIIRGAEFTNEFTNIATAVNSKVDSSRVLTDVPAGAVFTDTVYTKPTSEPISYITGLQTALDAKVDDSQVLTNVPENAVFTDTVYTKPTSEPISYITGLQTALDGKVSTSDTDFVKLTNVTVSSTEINYLSGVTSNIQTQLDNIDGSPWNVGSDNISIYTGGTFGGVYVFDRNALSSGSGHYLQIDHDSSLPNSYYNQYTYQGTTTGSITRSGTTGVAYNTSSDYRLKENVAAVDNAADRLKQLKPCRFNFIGEQRTVDGFLAHEAQEVVPESVTGEKDAVDSEGSPVYQGIDQSKLVPLLTAALQEALARIETLEATVNGGGA
jgi:hypothetical protein